MNRAARLHLLACCERRGPMFILRAAPGDMPPTRRRVLELLEFIRQDNRIVLPPAARMEIILPKNQPRAVGGRSSRRRGVRDKPPPLRIIRG